MYKLCQGWRCHRFVRLYRDDNGTMVLTCQAALGHVHNSQFCEEAQLRWHADCACIHKANSNKKPGFLSSISRQQKRRRSRSKDNHQYATKHVHHERLGCSTCECFRHLTRPSCSTSAAASAPQNPARSSRTSWSRPVAQSGTRAEK